MRSHYSVSPRYTPGSPAMVDERTALKVAREERVAHAHALTGVMGPTEQATAKAEGLSSIALLMVEQATGWKVFDLLCLVWRFWPHAPKCPRCGKKVAAHRGVISQHDVAYRHGTYPCDGSGQYVGKLLADEPAPSWLVTAARTDREHEYVAPHYPKDGPCPVCTQDRAAPIHEVGHWTTGEGR